MRLTLFLAICLGVATPAMAQCVAPVPPAPVDGATATDEQLRIAMSQAREYIAQSDIYQSCVGSELQATDLTNISFKSLEASVKARVAANQAMKEKVGAAANAAVQANKLAHPN